MLKKEEMIAKRHELFNEDFSIKKNDQDEIINFCRQLTDITGIQCCNVFGYTNELLPKIYNSCIKII